MTKLRNALKTNAVIVNFTKADGTERVMRATTNPELIKGKKVIDTWYEAKGTIIVWDLDVKGFRTIKESRVHDWNVDTIK